MRGWLQDLGDLVLPAECGGCGMPRTVLCPECRGALNGAAPSRVRPVPEPLGLPVVHAAARYEDEVRAVLLAHKERGALALAGPLGTALAGAVRAGLDGALCGGTGVLLVPVPSARRAVRARGHDPARRIALAAAGELRGSGIPARVLAVLRQRRAVADQAGLNSRQRLDNLADALSVAAGGGRLLAGAGAVVLVDDLMTTGASLAEAARAVREAVGYEEMGGAKRAERSGEVGKARGVRNAVYSEAGREGRGQGRAGATAVGVERRPGVPGMVAAGAFGGMICAAVVAATPDSFEINRN
ncbi:ComF family protein [Streptomyces sp. SID12501]|uniref:ComF family protein n=1 Tax=Streptomyces sp. SID12501 TaxID=2706042 RepID=A0A6B3C273_9ACTN|nr:ComF family protein [Streptomyces sp. SID12501]NEC90823.1 ComF family protein [Streptomyces sp. SID12501]